MTPDAEAIAIMEAVDAGTVHILERMVTEAEPTLVVYVLTNDWRLRVFDDCGDWDYLDSYARPGGEWVETSEAPDGALWWRPAHLWRWGWAPDGTSPTGYTTEVSVHPPQEGPGQ